MVVAAVGRLIARSLRRQGLPIDTDMVVAGALLHDIGKTPCLGDDGSHAGLGAEICLDHGLDTIAPIVARHVILRDFRPQGDITETEIVYYADKRVKHDKVVNLDERLRDILKRYGHKNPELHRLIRKNFQVCLAVEEKIFKLLPFAPDDVGPLAGRETVLPDTLPSRLS